MSNKKEKIGMVWPKTSYFTIKDLIPLNPQIPVEISLRVKLIAAVDDKVVAEIGFIPGGKGRPPKVYSMTPVTKLTLDKAEASNIQLVDKAREKFFNVISVSKSYPSPTITPANILNPVRV